jgi:APA family basic amino acid/polyamine antiporter
MKLNREIGLAGGIALVVGGVIGMGAFVLIPLICSKAGGAAWLAITIAMVLSLVSVFPLIQLASAIPIAGAGFEYGRKLISPAAGVLFSWWSIVGGAAGLALVAYGLVESFAAWLPQGANIHIVSLLLILLFYLVYLSGVKILAVLQIVLSVQMLLAIFLYAFPVMAEYGGNATFTWPQNSNFLMAIILSFNICLGLQIIIELGEEMKSPEKNIPLSLIIGSAVILFLYLIIMVAYSGIVGADNLANRPDLVLTAGTMLPGWAILFIRMGIISAALTSFNGTAIAIPREIFGLARAGIMPAAYAKINDKGNPQYAISLFFAITCLIFLAGYVLEKVGILGGLFGKDIIEFYGFVTIMGIMLLTLGISVATWRLPKVLPESYKNAYIRFSPGWLRFFVIISIVTSLFLIILVSTKWLIPAIYIFVTASVLLVFQKHFKTATT